MRKNGRAEDRTSRCTALLIASVAQPALAQSKTPASQPSPTADSTSSSNTSPSTGAIHSAIEELKHALPFPNGVDVSEDTVTTYGSSENSYHPSSSHSVVVRPRNTEDVVKIVQISREYLMPIVCYSGATSLEGHFRAPSVGAICVDMSRMDKILELHGTSLVPRLPNHYVSSVLL